MSHAGTQMFMEKLKQLINCEGNELINNPVIISERPQFELLYDDMASIIQILVFIDKHQGLDKLNDLKQRFIDTAQLAEYSIDTFLSGVRISNNGKFSTDRDLDLIIARRSFESVNGHLLTSGDLNPSSLLFDDVRRSWFNSSDDDFNPSVLLDNVRRSWFTPSDDDFNPSLLLDDVRRSFKYLEMEFMSIKMDLSESTLIQSPPATISTSTNSHKKLSDQIVVGLDRDVQLIRDKLMEDHKKLDVVSIVGMGGIGKSTLATNLFSDPFVVYHFHVRVWLTVSQTYDKRSVLTQILASIGVKQGLEQASDSRLREMVHKRLMGRRYLIVIDDIWDTEAWDNLKLFFPLDNTGSRVLLTTRFTEVAKHAKPDGLIHHMGSLNQERSWELLCQKVFHGDECPEWSVKPGMQIVENCRGLPLAVVVIAGVLAKEAWSKTFWVDIAERTSSYIVGEENGCLETLGLSYNHLPPHLRECFLYLGGFPEDYNIQVNILIWLWVAEGFIQEDVDGHNSLEDTAEGYLMDLIHRNLVIVDSRKSNGGVKACKMHDLVRELCLKKAKEEGFLLETGRSILSCNAITPPYRPVHMFINDDINIPDHTHPSSGKLRSILGFEKFRYFIYRGIAIATCFCSFMLLRVLDLHDCELEFPQGIELLVHLRYIEIWYSYHFPSVICKLWNLQTLIYNSRFFNDVLPSNISDLVNLRHLRTQNWFFGIDSIDKPMNLQSISTVKLEDEAFNFPKYFPCIKKLSCVTKSYKQNDFKSFNYLETLSLRSFSVHEKNHITLPATLKALTLKRLGLPWSDMSIIQSLPNLQVLKLRSKAFMGSCWNTDGQKFPQLKYLGLECLDIKQWEVYSPSFPCLKQLEFRYCKHLEEIPLEVGDIPTLELIKIKKCRPSVDESVRRIQQEQQDMGNYDLKIEVTPSEDNVV